MLRFPRVMLMKYVLNACSSVSAPSGVRNGPFPRAGSPVSGCSTLITSAPRSAMSIVENGPARMRVRSMTRMPSSGPGMGQLLVRKARNPAILPDAQGVWRLPRIAPRRNLRDDARVNEERETEGQPGLLSREALPVFSAFFLWGFGTGALWMARPLLAFDLGGTFFLVGLVSAFSAAPRIVGGPLAGALADRLGRRPIVVAGCVLHGGAAAMQGFTDSYAVFLWLELISGFGVAVWVTGSAALLADFTRVTNRGRGVALRNMSMRLGILAGPAAAGVIATAFDIGAVMVFIGVTKIFIIVVTWLLVRETRHAPAPVSEPGERPRRRLRLDVSIFRTRNFLTLSVVTLAIGLVTAGPGAFRTYFPVQAEDVGLSVANIGAAISMSGLIAMLISMPVGAVVDWWGRKPVLLIGLVTMAASMFLIFGMRGC